MESTELGVVVFSRALFAISLSFLANVFGPTVFQRRWGPFVLSVIHYQLDDSSNEENTEVL